MNSKTWKRLEEPEVFKTLVSKIAREADDDRVLSLFDAGPVLMNGILIAFAGGYNAVDTYEATLKTLSERVGYNSALKALLNTPKKNLVK